MTFDCEKLIRVILEIEHRDEGFHTKVEEAMEWSRSNAPVPWCAGSEVFCALEKLFPDTEDLKEAMSSITNMYDGWLKARDKRL